MLVSLLAGHSTTSTGPLRKREILGAVAVASVLIGVFWWITLQGRAIGIPRADDWSYLLSAFAFYPSGEIVLNNWAGMMLVGHLALAWPVIAFFGENIQALQITVALLSVFSLVLLYTVIRLALCWWTAALSTLILGVSPIFGPSTISFMTDIPGLALTTGTLGLGILSLRRPKLSFPLFMLSMIAGLAAFTIREFTIIATIAVLLSAFALFREPKTRIIVTGTGVVVAATVLGLYSWRNSLPDSFVLEGWSIDASIRFAAQGSLSLAFLITPVLIAINWRRIFESLGRFRVGYVGFAGILSICIWFVAGGQFLGNVLFPFGSTWLVQGPGIRLWSLTLNRLFMLIAIVSLALLVVLILIWTQQLWRLFFRPLKLERSQALFSHLSSDRRALLVLALYSLLLLGTHLVATLGRGAWLIDRYLILVLPFFAASILGSAAVRNWLARGPQIWASWVALALMFILSLHIVDFGARFDGARWAMGETLVNQGYTASSIDAGMQWVSFNAKAIGVNNPIESPSDSEPWWTARYPDQTFCVSVFGIEGRGGTPEAIETFKVTTLFGREYLLEARPGPDTCP